MRYLYINIYIYIYIYIYMFFVLFFYIHARCAFIRLAYMHDRWTVCRRVFGFSCVVSAYDACVYLRLAGLSLFFLTPQQLEVDFASGRDLKAGDLARMTDIISQW